MFHRGGYGFILRCNHSSVCVVGRNFSAPLTLLKNGENIILAGVEKLSINFYKWKESTLTVLPVLEFITIVLILIYYGEDVGIL